MKTRFSTLDLFAVLHDIQPMVGMRVVNVYDIDSKTYLIKLQKPDHKAVILFESGVRLHPTAYDWPKQQSPSGFSMKLRKHIKQKRLESVHQLGVDRIVDFQFGGDDRACHVIVELYDRGNVVLTDADYIILNVLRPRTDKDVDVRFAVREKYPVELARQSDEVMTLDRLKEILASAKTGDNLRKVLAPFTQYGPALLEHCFITAGFPPNCQLGKTCDAQSDVEKLHAALVNAHQIYLNMRTNKAKGFLTTKMESRVVDPATNTESESGAALETYQEFHPLLFVQLAPPFIKPEFGFRELETFGQAVDEFFSKRESQKSELKALQQERDAMKKLQNVKNDHEQRLVALDEAQAANDRRAGLIEMNKELVDKAILVIRSALANQLGWEAIQQLIDDATKRGDVVASAIKGLKLDISHITMQLTDPYAHEDDDEEDNAAERTMRVDIDLNLGAYQNARKYYDSRRAASVKQQKTVDASKKALKSAEHKAHEALKLVKVRANVIKHRKPIWFEKFFWFISSENYLVIGGRDAQQNELIVKRHLNAGDVYVHADIRGASSVVIKNRPGCSADDIPPKTLNEAGTMAVCYSAAWEAKVVTGAWWVKHDQVSRTAPSGEYLTSGSFMIRGKKNYLPPAQLQMGFGFLFKLDEDSVERHKGERKQHVGPVVDDVIDQGDDVELVNDEAESSDSEPPGDESFPDVQVGLQRLTSTGNDKEEEQVTILQLGPRRPERPPVHVHGGRPSAVDEQKSETDSNKHNEQPNRRQRHKQQKMKTKYKDQDDEERELRLELLGSIGEPKMDRKAQRKAKKSGASKTNTPSVRPAPKQPAPKQTNTAPPSRSSNADDQHDNGAPPTDDQTSETPTDIEQVPSTKETDEDAGPTEGGAADEEEAEDGEAEEIDELAVLDTLTAVPVGEDTLLFALGVCAPYQVMTQYKYKVKLTPGQGKRGKAGKTALLVFQKDRNATPRERDLLKATAQDQDLSRNMPGKVKVSAPQLLAAKTKK